MAAIKAVRDTAPDPKIGTTRRTSGVVFPYYDLAQSIDVARVIHEKAGGSCTREQLAALLGYKGVKNGSFLTRVTAAKTFGLIEQDEARLRLSPRGQAIISPVMEGDAEAARLDAFMSVDLFGKVYDEFQGRTLPPQAGLQNLLKDRYQVVPDRVVPTVRIMLESADQAGLFSIAGNRTKMIPPLQGTQPPEMRVTAEQPVGSGATAEPPARRSGGGSGGDGNNPRIHAAILGLLNELPAVGTTLTAKKRKALIDAFSYTVSWIYPEEEAGV